MAFQHLTFQEFALASRLLAEGRTFRELLDELWMSPRYEETLAMALGIAAAANRTATDEAIHGLVVTCLDRHRADPSGLWEHKRNWGIDRARSPLRTVLHVLFRSGETLSGLQRTSGTLDRLVEGSQAMRLSIAADPNSPTEIFVRLAADADADGEVRGSAARNASALLEDLAAIRSS